MSSYTVDTRSPWFFRLFFVICITERSLTTLGRARTTFPLVQTMPAEFVSFLSFLSTQRTNYSYVLFVTSFYHRVALGTFLNTHSLDQVVPGDLLLKLQYLVICQNSQAPHIYVVPFFAAINWWLVLANVGTQKSRSACVQDAATIYGQRFWSFKDETRYKGNVTW